MPTIGKVKSIAPHYYGGPDALSATAWWALGIVHQVVDRCALGVLDLTIADKGMK